MTATPANDSKPSAIQSAVSDVIAAAAALPPLMHYAGKYAQLITLLLKGDGSHTVEQIEHDFVSTGRRRLLVKKHGEAIAYEITITPIYPEKKL